MKKSKLSNRKIFYIFSALFIVLNIVNTYFLTSNTLNRYLVTFDRTFLGELNSIIGNLAIILLIYCLTIILVKNTKKQLLTLTLITLFLNIGIFSLTIFTKFYGTAMSFRTLTVFKNPALELGFSIVFESLKDLVLYYRIVLFVPFGVLLYFYFKYDKKEPIGNVFIIDSLKYKFSSLFVVIFLVVINITVFYTRLEHKWRLNSARTTYVTQNIGLYSFYTYEIVNDFKVDLKTTTSDHEFNLEIESYNKNKQSYINFLDNKEYSNKLNYNDLNGVTYYDSSLTNELNGVFKDKNLVLYHLESFNYFLVNVPEIKEHMPFMSKLLEESYVLSNFYANIGVGTSADAEFSVLTGLYPTGNTTLYWDYTYEFNEKLILNSVVKYFNESNYYTEAIHGDVPEFYNRGEVYPKLYEFDWFYDLDSFNRDGYKNDDYNHKNPWISDYALSDVAYLKGNSFTEPYFMFLMNMMPHTPFLYDPYKNNPITFNDKWEKDISEITLRYLRYMKYYDEVIKRLFVDPNNGTSRVLENTVYMFYGDHGSGLTIDDLKIILNDDNLTQIEARRNLNNTLAFIYAPSDEETSTKGINKGLIRGENNLVRSQVDMYRTIVELFDLPATNDYYFGVNLLSKEPTFSLDARVLDAVLDHKIFSLINEHEVQLDGDLKRLKDWIYKRKLLNDLLIERSAIN